MNSSQQNRFGPEALRLGVRFCGLPESGRLVFRSAALSPEDRRELGAWARLFTERDGSGDTRLECELAPLSEAARNSMVAAVFLAAHEAATRARPAPRLMGVLNVTPDSFSDGGLHLERERALEAGLRMAREGAEWIDVGGESTRPGAQSVPIEEELRRVIPVIEDLRRERCAKISVDTRRARVAAAAIEAGAEMVNDVGAGLDDPGMLEVVRDAGCAWVLMHRQGSPRDMQRAPGYIDALGEITEFLRGRVGACLEAGIEESELLIDPGIGFGKGLEHNLDLLKRLPELRSLGIPLLVGPSRKSFIGHVTGSQEEGDWERQRTRNDPADRIGGTAAAITFCVMGGAEVLRVHDVAVMAEACAVAGAIAARPTLP